MRFHYEPTLKFSDEHPALSRRRTGRAAPGRCKMWAGVLMIVAAAGTSGVAAASVGTGTPPVKPAQGLAILLTSHKVVSTLYGRPSRGRTVQASRPITGGPTVLPVSGRATTKDGAHWLQVMIPGRPNGARGWIEQRGTMLTTTNWHVVVRTSSRRLLVYREGRLVQSFAAIVGKPSTPTPHGQFFVEESVQMLPGSAGAPFALALSARSNVLQEFEGGPGQIAIHGMENLGGILGTASSHGCVRLDDQSIRWLAARITPGVLVTIT
jgi:lipoprotein-anchoring transpeptidase ErfK/SrfK